jgi:hypothetical protein
MIMSAGATEDPNLDVTMALAGDAEDPDAVDVNNDVNSGINDDISGDAGGRLRASVA